MEILAKNWAGKWGPWPPAPRFLRLSVLWFYMTLLTSTVTWTENAAPRTRNAAPGQRGFCTSFLIVVAPSLIYTLVAPLLSPHQLPCRSPASVLRQRYTIDIHIYYQNGMHLHTSQWHWCDIGDVGATQGILEPPFEQGRHLAWHLILLAAAHMFFCSSKLVNFLLNERQSTNMVLVHVTANEDKSNFSSWSWIAFHFLIQISLQNGTQIMNIS